MAEANRKKIETLLDEAVLEGMMLLLQTEPSLVLLLATNQDARDLVKASLMTGAAGMAAIMMRDGYADKTQFQTGG